MKRTKPRRAKYKKIFKREKKIALARYGQGFYLLSVKKSAAAKYKQKR